jgi:hypothetical protein
MKNKFKIALFITGATLYLYFMVALVASCVGANL